MADQFQHFTPGLESPAAHGAAITPDDDSDLAHIPRALFATGAGVVRMTLAGGGDPVSVPILAGPALCLRPCRIWATGTTATGLVGVW